jgi:hypothetical protein
MARPVSAGQNVTVETDSGAPGNAPISIKKDRKHLLRFFIIEGSENKPSVECFRIGLQAIFKVAKYAPFDFPSNLMRRVVADAFESISPKLLNKPELLFAAQYDMDVSILPVKHGLSYCRTIKISGARTNYRNTPTYVVARPLHLPG